MGTPGKGTRRIIKKYAISREVRHYEDRRNQTFDDDGLPISLELASAVVGKTYAIVAGVATVASVDHGLETGQQITVTDDSYVPGTGAVLDGVHVITATGDDTFTFPTTEADRSGKTLTYAVTISVKIHDQPLSGKILKYLPEGQRLEDVRRGWTIEIDSIKEGDEVNIDGFIFTVQGVQHFQTGVYGHKEFNLLRTGDQDNLWI